MESPERAHYCPAIPHSLPAIVLNVAQKGHLPLLLMRQINKMRGKKRKQKRKRPIILNLNLRLLVKDKERMGTVLGRYYNFFRSFN